MHGAMKRHEIQVLKRAGLTIRQIADQAGVSPSTIKRIVREKPVKAVSDQALAAERKVGRPSKAESFRDFVADLSLPRTRSVLILKHFCVMTFRGISLG